MEIVTHHRCSQHRSNPITYPSFNHPVDPVSSAELDSSYDTLEYVFDRKANPQRPIRFDRMKLRSLQTAEKLALSYPMAQSSKLFVFESKVCDLT